MSRVLLTSLALFGDCGLASPVVSHQAIDFRDLDFSSGPPPVSAACLSASGKVQSDSATAAALKKLSEDAQGMSQKAGSACVPEMMKSKTCHEDLDWSVYKSDVDAAGAAASKVDSSSKICFMNSQYTIAVPNLGNVTFYVNATNPVPMPQACSTADRAAFTKWVAEQTCSSSAAGISGCSFSWSSSACASSDPVEDDPVEDEASRPSGDELAPDASSCGPKRPSPVADCDRVDLGSCGNACCGIEMALPVSAENAYTGVTEWLQSGGEDKSFTYVNSSDAAGHNPGDDLRSFNLTFQFIFQGTHRTSGGFVDTLDFNIRKSPSGSGSIIRAFSISNIHGALGDNGQNYKTLKYMASHLQPGADLQVVVGCGAKNPAMPSK